MKNSRILLTGLLLGACILTGALLVSTPSVENQYISEIQEIDDLIEASFSEYGIDKSQYRTFLAEIDTSFSRKIYRIEVPPEFSKTSFHLKLHHKFIPFGLSSPARVTFPEEDMEIHVVYNQTVFRTIRLVTLKNTDSSG